MIGAQSSAPEPAGPGPAALGRARRPAPAGFWRRVARRDPWPVFAFVVVGAVTALMLLLVGATVWLSLFPSSPIAAGARYTLANYAHLLHSAFLVQVAGNTLGFAALATVVALAVGVPAAWLAERTDFPHKTLLYSSMTAGLLVPGFLTALGWLLLLGPRIGVVNQLLRAALGRPGVGIDIATVAGMGCLQGVLLAPVAFIMTAASFRRLDPTLEEAAQGCGAGLGQTLRLVTLPVLWPNLAGAAIYILTIGMAAFDVPAVIGLSRRVFTFSTYIYQLASPAQGSPRYGPAGALGFVVVLLGAALSVWYTRVIHRAERYGVVSGRAYRRSVFRLGPRACAACTAGLLAFVAAVFAAPLLAMLWSSLLPYLMVPSGHALAQVSLGNFRALPWGLLMRALRNSLLLMGLVPTVTVLILALSFSWVVLRSRTRLRRFFDGVAFLPHVVPGMVFGLAMLFVSLFVLRRWLPVYGTVWILLISYCVAFLSFGTRMTNGAWIQIRAELEESAQVCGASGWQVVRHVVAPLCLPALASCWLWIALLAYRELAIPAVLTTGGNVTLTMAVYGLYTGGGMGSASAAAVIFVAGLAPLVAVFWILARRADILESMSQ